MDKLERMRRDILVGRLYALAAELSGIKREVGSILTGDGGLLDESTRKGMRLLGECCDLGSGHLTGLAMGLGRRK